MSSAAICPPALRTSSRNSARDSSTSRPGEVDKRPEGGVAAICGAGPPDGPAPKRSPGLAKTLLRERTSRSTATKTARSGVLPERPRSAAEDCDRPAALPGLYSSRVNRGGSRARTLPL